MSQFAPLLAVLSEVPDPRRGQGQKYKLSYVLLFSILAIVTGCNSYRGIVTFINVHRSKLNAAFGLAWRRAPAHTAIRYILQGPAPADVEAALRQHAARLQAACTLTGPRSIALDGKTLHGSFDNFNDRLAPQVLSAFATDTSLALAHRHCRKIQRNPRSPDGARRTRGPGRHPGHARCAPLSTKHFEVVKQAGIALIIQVKNNQPTLLQTITGIADTAKPLSTCKSHDKGRNRDENRIVTVFDPAKNVEGTDWQDHVRAIVRDERVVYTRNAKTGLFDRIAEVAF